MTELSDVVLAQNRTSILLRAFLKIFRIYFLSSLVIALSGAGYVYLTLHNLGDCATTDAEGNCAPSVVPPALCLYIIAIFAVGSMIMTFTTVETALTSTEAVEK